MDRSNREEQLMYETFVGSSCTFPYIKHSNVCLPSFAAAASYDVRKFYFIDGGMNLKVQGLTGT